MVLKPGARQDWAMKPSLSSAKQMTSSPCFQSQLGMFSKYAWNVETQVKYLQVQLLLRQSKYLQVLSVLEIYLVMILHQLYDNSNIVTIIFDRNYSHYIGSILKLVAHYHYHLFIYQFTSASGSGQYLFARTKQASASST